MDKASSCINSGVVEEHACMLNISTSMKQSVDDIKYLFSSNNFYKLNLLSKCKKCQICKGIRYLYVFLQIINLVLSNWVNENIVDATETSCL